MIPWLVLALIAAVFAVVFVKQRAKKANKTSNHYIVLVDGFPITHVPTDGVSSRKEARASVVKLKEVYKTAWHIMSEDYGVVDPREAPIESIGMSTAPVHPEHNEVVWFAPTSKMRLRFQPSMYYHFAGELHNMFRFNMHGVKWIHIPKDEDDAARAAEVQRWIEENYG